MKDKILKILKLSREFKALRPADINQGRQNIVNYLNQLSKVDLLEFKNKLEISSAEKINKIRLLIINFLLEKGSFSSL